MTNHTDPAAFWDEHYRRRTHTPPSRPNPRLGEITRPLPPTTVLDLGCGSGGDALWLAETGWRVTAVDIAQTAVDTLRQRATAARLPITATRVDLATDFPDGHFDLVSAQYFQTPFTLDRARVLRTAMTRLNPGGRLAVVDHGSTAPWSWVTDPHQHYPTPTEVAADLDLDAEWTIERADTPQRPATGPDGTTATVIDHILVIRRATR